MLSDSDWNLLLSRIKSGDCTPFIGAGASAGRIPVAREIALKWAENHKYPLADREDLARVAQFVAVTADQYEPKRLMAEECRNALPSNLGDEIHDVLAELALPIYITTNYDNFMYEALERRGVEPQRAVCRWNAMASRNPLLGRSSRYEPTPARPLVFHLHGFMEDVASMVVSESDYLDFLVALGRDTLLPAPITRALAGTSLLFIGYGRNDWDFRVLFRGLIGSLGASLEMLSVAVQHPPMAAGVPGSDDATTYLENYFAKIGKVPVRVYWGGVEDFALELRRRWRTAP